MGYMHTEIHKGKQYIHKPQKTYIRTYTRTDTKTNKQANMHTLIHIWQQTGRQATPAYAHTHTSIIQTCSQSVATQSQQCKNAEAQASYTHRHTEIYRDGQSHTHITDMQKREACVHIHNGVHSHAYTYTNREADTQAGEQANTHTGWGAI